MNYPPYPSQSGNSFPETFENLVQLRRSLLALCAKIDVIEKKAPRHSLFSSQRSYRADELHLGLSVTKGGFSFSKN